jgi:hypothetical protein
MSEIVNAKIRSTQLGIEDHGHMTCYLFLDYNDWGSQGFGGYALDSEAVEDNNNSGIRFIRGILETLGLTDWDDLKGHYVRVKVGGVGSDRHILAIGHIIEDKWFDPREFYNKYYPKD